MAQSFSIATAVDNSSFFGNLTADDGSLSRIRDAQVCVCTAFGNLAVPDGATIDGIQLDMEGYAAPGDLDGAVGNWISVSNDGGSTFSTAQSEETWDFSTNSGALSLERSGDSTDLWGMTWNATTANAIQVRMGWGGSPGAAVYLDYVKITIYYTEAPYVPKFGDNIILKDGVMVLKGGTLTIK